MENNGEKKNSPATVIMHPFLFVIFPPLFLFSENYYQVEFLEVLPPLLFLILFALLAFFIPGSIIADSYIRALVLSGFLFIFFTFGHFHNWVNISLAEGVDLKFKIMLWLSLALVLLGFFFLLRYFFAKEGGLAGLTEFLNVSSLALVSISLISIGFKIINYNKQRVDPVKKIFARAKKINRDLPDIYLFLLDGYARDDILKKYYQYDNSNFSQFLKKKGFRILKNSHSNYGFTLPALSSLFNFSLHQFGPEHKGLTLKDNKIFTRLIWNNRLLPLLKSLGYTSVSFDSGGGRDIHLRSVDVFFATPGWNLSDFQVLLIRTTIIPYLVDALHKCSKKFFIWDLYNINRKRFFYTLKKVEEISKNPGLKFVFAHFLQPHEPFLFNADGSAKNPPPGVDGTVWFIPFKGRNKEDYIKGYTGQLSFLNNKIKSLVDRIFSNSKKEPIIIIFSDHGPALQMEPYDMAKSNLNERFSNLMAFYFPHKKLLKLLKPNMTPVNTFPFLFKHIFKMNTPALPDRSFFAPADDFYHFQDITDRVNAKKNPE
ncbi:sulfatase-like hydrolase/transferase [Candidatus Riflebacteria bacterium]